MVSTKTIIMVQSAFSCEINLTIRKQKNLNRIIERFDKAYHSALKVPLTLQLISLG